MGIVSSPLKQLFERMLANENVLVLKFWLHLSKKEQKKRLQVLEKSDKTKWRVTPTDWDHHRRYDKFRKVSERALRESSSTEAPWIVVEATDARYRDLTIATAIAQKDSPQVDVVMADLAAFQQGIAQGIFAELDQSAVPNLAQMVDSARIGDTGITPYADILAIVYNKEVFERNGWTPPTTWADLFRPELKGMVIVPSGVTICAGKVTTRVVVGPASGSRTTAPKSMAGGASQTATSMTSPGPMR